MAPTPRKGGKTNKPKKKKEKKNKVNAGFSGQNEGHASSSAVKSSEKADRKRQIDQAQTIENLKQAPTPSSYAKAAKRPRGISKEELRKGDLQSDAISEDTQALVATPDLPGSVANQLEVDRRKPQSSVITLASSGELKSERDDEDLNIDKAAEAFCDDHRDYWNNQERHPGDISETKSGKESQTNNEDEPDHLCRVRNTFEESYNSTKERIPKVQKGVQLFGRLPVTRESIDLQRKWLDSLGYIPRDLTESYSEALENEMSLIDAAKKSETLFIDAAKKSETLFIDAAKKSETLENEIPLIDAATKNETFEEFSERLAPNTKNQNELFDLFVAQKEAKQKAEIAKKDAEIAKKDAVIAKQKAEIAEEKARHYKKDVVADLSNAITDYNERFQSVYTTLNTMAGQGQESNTLHTRTYNKNNETAKNAFMKDNDDGRDHGGKEVDHEALKSNENVSADRIKQFNCWSCDNIDDMIKEELNTLNKSPENKKSLQHICSVLNDWLSRSEVVKKEKKKEEKEKGCTGTGHKEKCKIGIDHMNARLRDNTLDFDESKGYCPSMVATEVAGCHSSIACVVDAIAKDTITKVGHLDTEQPTAFSPSKNAKRNCRIPSLELRGDREVDLCIEKPGLYHILMLDSAMKLPVEIKPLFRENTGPDVLDKECLKQVLSHLAKYLIKCINFHSVGTSSFATGAICTLAYIKVVQLYLVMDEGKVELKLQVSKRLPLISREAFEQWIENDDKEKFPRLKPKLRNDLYGGQYHCDNIPKGILVLRALVRYSRKYFFGPNFGGLCTLNECEVNGKKVETTGNVLGHGSFGVVLKVNQEDLVLKAPALTSTIHLENEAHILTKLGRLSTEAKAEAEADATAEAEADATAEAEAEAKDFLSFLERKTSVRVKLGFAEKNAPALLLRPKGKPLSTILKSLSKNGNQLCNDYTEAAMVQIKTALEHMHCKGFVHNDVTPKNIIIVSNDTSNTSKIKMCLVDFGIACEKGKDVKYFLGSRPFAHDKHFWAYPGGCKVDPKCDFFSLVLTCCAILKRGDPTWDMGAFPRVKKEKPNDEEDGLYDVLKERRSKAEAIINEHFSCATEAKEKMEYWLDKEYFSQDQEPKHNAKRKKNVGGG